MQVGVRMVGGGGWNSVVVVKKVCWWTYLLFRCAPVAVAGLSACGPSRWEGTVTSLRRNVELVTQWETAASFVVLRGQLWLTVSVSRTALEVSQSH